MKKQTSRQLILELTWWAFVAILVALVLLPIYSARIEFPFYAYNIVAIVVAITITRYIFTLHINWMRDRFIILAALSFLMIPTVFFIGQGLNEYITYLDNNGPDVFISHLELESGKSMSNYLDSEYYFFGVWAVIAGVIFPFRVIFWVWKRYRKVKR